MFQKCNDSKTCRKYKNVSCRLNFGQFLTKQTIVAEHIDDDLDDERKSSILTKRREILCLVKQNIDEVLNPSKESYDDNLTETDILNSIGITEDEYYWPLSISRDSNLTYILKDQ